MRWYSPFLFNVSKMINLKFYTIIEVLLLEKTLLDFSISFMEFCILLACATILQSEPDAVSLEAAPCDLTHVS